MAGAVNAEDVSGSLRTGKQFGDAEIENLGTPVSSDEDVVWLEVPVHDALVMGCGKAGGDLLGIVQRRSLRERSRTQRVSEWFALEQFGDDKGLPMMGPDVEHRNDIRVIEGGRRAGFLLEAREAIGIGTERTAERTFTATSRCKRVSRARYTSPMPPEPRWPITSYAPSRSPEVISMAGYLTCEGFAHTAERMVSGDGAQRFYRCNQLARRFQLALFWSASARLSAGGGARRTGYTQPTQGDRRQTMPRRSDVVHERSLRDPAGFWAEAAESIDWHTKWERVCDDSRAPFYRWFAGAEVNTCYNALDRHVARGRSDQPALIYDSPVTGTVRILTFRELLDKVAGFAGALARLGVGKGDRVIIYMPMIPEAVIAMLAAARLGAIHSVVFGGFASHELATRIDDALPKVIITASCGIEPRRVVPYKPLLDAAIAMARHKPSHCVVHQRPMATAELIPGRDVEWNDAVAGAKPHECVPVAATDPLYICTRPGQPGSPRASCATTADTSSRSIGR